MPLCDDAWVITEQAVLDVQTRTRGGVRGRVRHCQGRSSRRAAGFVSLRLLRGIESPSRYLLLVEWETLEDHTEGFRKSAGYEEWRALLHHFYDPFPTVEHFGVMTTA